MPAVVFVVASNRKKPAGAEFVTVAALTVTALLAVTQFGAARFVVVCNT
jgi:hypothetical protein